jgi:hypothetical protein
MPNSVLHLGRLRLGPLPLADLLKIGFTFTSIPWNFHFAAQDVGGLEEEALEHLT